MKKTLLIALLLFTFSVEGQVTEDQTWEIYNPGVKLIYDINACANNTAEPIGEDYFFCDGPDRVIVKSFGLKHATVYDTSIFEYNNEKYISFSTLRGLSIYNKTTKKWKNIPFLALGIPQDRNASPIYSAIYVGDGKILFTGAGKGTYIFDLANNLLELQSNTNDVLLEEFKKNTNVGAFNNSVWGIDRYHKIVKYQDNVLTRIPVAIANADAANNNFVGFDIAPNNKLYIAVKRKGILVFDPNDNSHELITPENSDLPSQEINDVDFDADGNLWITYGTLFIDGGILKWDIANNTYQSFTTPKKSGIGTLFFNDIEVLNNKIWVNCFYTSSSLRVNNGIYKLSFDNNVAVWKHYDELFFQEKGFLEQFKTATNKPVFNNFREQEGALYFSTTNKGAIKYDGTNWSNYSSLRNNIPSGYSKTIDKLFQNKKGGISFTSISINESIDHLVELNEDNFNSYKAPKNSDFVNSSYSKGQLDLEGNFFSEIKKVNGVFSKSFQSLDFPDWTTFLNTTSEFTTLYAVEGINKWVLQGDNNRGGILTNLTTEVVYNKDNSNLNFNAFKAIYFTEDRDERLWAVSDGIKWYDPKTDTSGELIVPDVTGIYHSSLGNISKILFGANNNEVWLVALRGVIYLKDGVLKYTIANADSSVITSISDAKLDENNNLYLLGQRGLVVASNVNNTSPTIYEIDYLPTVSGAGPNLLRYSSLTIDNNGAKWLANNNDGFESNLLKFEDNNKGKGITNGALTSQSSALISGKVFIDVNENGVFDENIDGAISNQSINFKRNTSILSVFTDTEGNYKFPVFIPNQTYEIAISSTNGFAYTSDRIYEITVADLETNYNINIPLEVEDTESLYVKGATKEGLWGFNRDGFNNKFVTAVGNLSFLKSFADVKLRYQFINTNSARENYLNPAINSVKIYKVVNNVNTHIINKININSGRKQDWLVMADNAAYTKTEITNPIFTEVVEDKTVTLEINLNAVNPLETYVIEIETDVFDPVATEDDIQFGATAIFATNFSAASSNKNSKPSSNKSNSGSWLNITPASNDSRYGARDDFSPYTDPDDIYQDRDEIYKEPKDAYNDGPFLAPIFSSYDPNDKLVSPGVPGKINETDIQKKWLTYTVRFQNKGNFSAKDVLVLDTIDADLDRYSFRLLEASHNLKIEEIGNSLRSIKKFKFENIFLPDSLSSPDGSQGYFKYTIKAKEEIAENTIVNNTAYIYFDQNPAIITNTIQNKFRTPAVVSVKEFLILEKGFLFPNPASSNVTISFQNRTIQKIEIFNLIGGKVKQINVDNKNKVTTEVNNLSKGMYLVKIYSEGNIISKKLIIK